MFAETLKSYLEREFTVVGLVADGRSLIAEALRVKPDLIIVDISMPFLNGLDAARRIHEQAPDIKLVFLTMREDPNLAAAVMEMGPVGFVLKHSGSRELLKAIEHVMHGKPYLTPRLRTEDWVELRNRAKQFSKDLTRRQREIVQLFAEGRPIKEIADILVLSEKTVEFHKHHIMQAFNLRNNAELVLFAVRQGLISADPPPPMRSTRVARRNV